MATLTADKVASGISTKESNQHLVAVHSEYELTAALALNDVIQMVKVPKGAQILEIVLATEDLDTGGVPTIVLDVGDGGDTDRFIDGATVGQGGGSVRLGSGVAAAANGDAFGHTYAADDTIDILVQAAPATGAASGTICLTVIYHNDI